MGELDAKMEAILACGLSEYRSMSIAVCIW